MIRLLTRLTEAWGWLEIAAAPASVGLAAGLAARLALGPAWGAWAGGLLAAAGLAGGGWWAERVRRRQGTVAFMARLRATPELTTTLISMTLADLNALPAPDRAAALATCCGAATWVATLNQQFPFAAAAALYEAAARIWYNLPEADWREAFTHHPQIGDVSALRTKFASTAAWAAGEQGAVRQASEATLAALATGNAAYQQKFGYIFIVCATGKSAADMLALLQARLPHAPAEEIHVAMAEQAKITRLRLEKLLV